MSYNREKAIVYAKGNVEEYWLVDVENKKVEVYKNPNNGVYQNTKTSAFQNEIPAFGKFISLKGL